MKDQIVVVVFFFSSPHTYSMIYNAHAHVLWTMSNAITVPKFQNGRLLMT